VLPASFDESDPQDGDGYVYQDAIRIRVLQGLVGQTNALDSLEFLERWRARRATSRLIRARATTALSGPSQPAADTTGRDGALLTSVDSAKPLAELLEEAAPNAALVHGTQVAVMMQGVIAASRGAALASYYLDRHLAVAWVLGANETVHLRRLPTDSIELGKLRNTMLETMKRHDPRWRKTAAELYERLITPIEDVLPVAGAHAPVGIVPFSVLHGLPFQALLRRDELAVARYSFFYLPSLRSYPRMLELAARRSRVGPTVAFGFNDSAQKLTRAEDEATRVASKGYGFVRERATLTSFREQQSAAAVLHVSAHAEIDEVNPLGTSFRLSDGALHMSELLGMRPTARLLTLSAANGLRGSRLRGDEMTGLSAAALAGGLPSVLTSAWLVDDAAASAVMRSFYRRMETGTNLAVALAEAQQEVASSTTPAVWSAFSLWGADQ
jgi:CHAT domain-containing protein